MATRTLHKQSNSVPEALAKDLNMYDWLKVGMRGVSISHKGWLVLIVLLVSVSSIRALTVTPSEINLTEFSRQRETVITFYNDEFKPLVLELTTTKESEYLSTYVSFDREVVVLQPQEQTNVKLVTQFPSNLSPQRHQFVLLPNMGEKVNATISFRPPGTQDPGVQITDVQAQTEEALLIDMTLRNIGNVILKVKPVIQIMDSDTILKNFSYGQAIVLQPQEVYPLTLRQDLGDLASGEFSAVLRAEYVVDNLKGASENSVIHFNWSPETVVNEEQSQNRTWIYAIIAVAVLFIMLGFIWFGKRGDDRVYSSNIKELRKEKEKLRKDVQSLTKQTRQLVEEIQRWKGGKQ